MLEATGIQLSKEGAQAFLTNTLTDPGDGSDEGEQISFIEVLDALNDEIRRAGLVKKAKRPNRVFLGNLPYDRDIHKRYLEKCSRHIKTLCWKNKRTTDTS